MRGLWSRLGVLARRGDLARELDEELRSHLEMQERDLLERGADPGKARAAAMRRVGNGAAIAESAREAWGFPSVESFLHDIRHGARSMLRAPGFSAVVIVTLALGIGVTTAIFSVVHQVLLKPMPYPAAERIVRLGETTGRAEGISVSWGNFIHWRESNRSFETIAAYQFTERTLTGRGDAVMTRGLMVTAPYFPLLGMRPLLGRVFDERDDRPGAPPVIVLNHRFWAGRLGGDRSIIGATLILNGAPFEVAGVAAPLWEPWEVDYYLPLGMAAGNDTNRARHGSIRALARLRPGVTLPAARADLDGILRGLAAVDPGPENEHRSYGTYWAESNTSEVRASLWILMGAAALILLIASANVASLLAARNIARGGELALRRAIGAGHLRLARQLLTESVVIAAAGGAAGIALAFWGVRLLVALAPAGIPRLSDASLDVPVLLFACGISVAAGLAAGVAPAFVAGQVDLSAALKEGWRLAGTGRRRATLRGALVVAEIALTFVLAFGSGILLRSLIAAQRVDCGFNRNGLLSFELQLPSRSYRSAEALGSFYTSLLAGLRATPGVAGATAVYSPPGGGDRGDWFYSIAGRPAPPRNDVPVALFNTAAPGYFQTMSIPLREGREFTDADSAAGPKVAVVNETFARQWWPNGSAVGGQIKVGGPYDKGRLLEIVGVAGDVRQDGLDTRPAPEIWEPFAQRPGGNMAVMVRASGGAASLAPAIRARVRELDRDLPVLKLGTMDAALGDGLARRRFGALLLAAFASLALTLAAVGIFGMLSFQVGARRSEIAVRMALGAQPIAIMRWIGMHALRLASAGIALGLAGAWAAAHALEDQVFGVSALNPSNLAAAAAAVFVIALVASVAPARRAARVGAIERVR